jgi:predicted amidohydrolase
VPVAAPPLREIFGRELGTRPESRGLELDATSHLRILGTLAAGLTVQLATNQLDLLSTLEHPDAELAVAWTTSTDALAFECDAPAGRPRFHSVRPREPAAVNAALTKALADLSSPRAPTVVVLPELSLDPGGVQAARTEFERLGRPFDVVVLGSAHTPLTEEGCENVSTVCFRDGADGEHHKFNPFALVLPDAEGARVLHTEALRLGERVLTVYLGTRWSLTVLICKDLIDPGVTEALASVLVRIVLVPARTPRTSDFEAEALAHAARSQGIVVVANDLGGEAEPEAAAALIARPLRRGGLQRFPQPEGARPTTLRARLRG